MIAPAGNKVFKAPKKVINSTFKMGSPWLSQAGKEEKKKAEVVNERTAVEESALSSYLSEVKDSEGDFLLPMPN